MVYGKSVGLELKPAHVKRYAEIARLLWKYGRSDLVTGAGLDQALSRKEPEEHCPPAEACELANDLEEMGPRS